MVDTREQKRTGAEDVVWDLSVYYSGIDDPQIDADLKEADRLADEFVVQYRGKVGELSAAELKAAYEAYEALYDLVNKIDTYASLNYTVYSTDAKWGAFQQRIDEAASRLFQKLVFFTLEWNQVDDARAEEILNDPALGSYAYHLETARLTKDYQLTEPEERLLIEKSVTGRNAWVRLFSQIMASQTFEWDGETINQSTLLSKIQEGDRDVRKKAADMMTADLQGKKMELTYIYNTLAADKASDDRMRGYPSWITSRNISNKTPDDVYEALVETVTSNYDLVAKHYNLKRILLGVDELYDYDRYAPLQLKESETFYTWEDARRITVDSYGSFSPRAGEVAAKFFDGRWIHAPVMQGKRGGAYASYGTKATHPWVFVNFTGNANDVMTLAHELGHGLHMYLAGREQTLFSMFTPLTTAEMASTFGEMVVFKRLMANETDDEVKLGMLAEKIEGTMATVYRQIAMNRFEDRMHNARREQGELSTEQFNEMWMETQRAMFGDSVTLRDEYEQWWSYIPHFLHTPGYVYAYSFGELLVLALYKLYEQEGESFVPRYLDLLSAGDSDYPHKLLEKVGVNLNDPGFWQQGVDVLADLIDQEEKLAKSLFPDRV